jgi:hypothetical protein
MDRFVLNLEDESASVISKAKNSHQRFQSLRASTLTTDIKEIIVSHRLRHLQLSHCIVDGTILNECFTSLKCIESFICRTVRVDNKTDLKRVKLKTLRELVVDHSDIEMILMFDTDSLTTANFSPSTTEGASAILPILKMQKQLKKLAIGGFLGNRFLTIKGMCELQIATLKHFRFTRGPPESATRNELSKFLANHGPSLTTVELIYPVEANMCKTVINSMINLVYCDIPIDALSAMDDALFEELLPHPNLRGIKLLGRLTKFERAIAIMDIFPALISINLSDLTTGTNLMQLLLHLTRSKPQLEALHISTFIHNFDNQLYFPNLKEFGIKKIEDYNQNYYNQFLTLHANTLMKISIASTNDNFIKSVTLECMMQCKRLNYVSITSDSPMITRMFNTMAKREHKWTLESNVTSGMKRVQLKFAFPQDRKIFLDELSPNSQALMMELSTFGNSVGLTRFVNKFK